MSREEFLRLIEYPNEERHIEFKENAPWKGNSKNKITKSIISMSNLRDGGWIIFGKKEKADKSYENVGVSQSTYEGYINDDVKAYVYSHAQPPIELELFKEEVEGKKYVGLRIHGLGETPHICFKQEGKTLLKGKIYGRSQRIPESAEIQNYIEMKEIIDVCVDNALTSYLQRMNRAGIAVVSSKIILSEKEKFNNEARDII